TMADLKRRLAANTEGSWFVDETCINCDACRQYAPDVFAEVGDYSVVQHQPQTADQIWRAELALLACPVGSIGARGHKVSARDDVADAGRFAEHFGARVWIHETEQSAAPFATNLLTGLEAQGIRDKMLAIPVPGHTRGSVVYLLEDKYLFTGDSLSWSRGRGD